MAPLHWASGSPDRSMTRPTVPMHFDFLTEPLFWVAALAALRRRDRPRLLRLRRRPDLHADRRRLPRPEARGRHPLHHRHDPDPAASSRAQCASSTGVRCCRSASARCCGAAGAARARHASTRSPLRWGAVARDPRLGRRCLRRAVRYRGPTRVWLSLIVGAIAGFMSGSVQIPGPPVLIYWLGRDVVSATMRANAIVFFMFTTVISSAAFIYAGIFTADVILRAAVSCRSTQSAFSSAAACSALPARRPIAPSPTPRFCSRRWCRCRCSDRARAAPTCLGPPPASTFSARAACQLHANR